MRIEERSNSVALSCRTERRPKYSSRERKKMFVLQPHKLWLPAVSVTKPEYLFWLFEKSHRSYIYYMHRLHCYLVAVCFYCCCYFNVHLFLSFFSCCCPSTLCVGCFARFFFWFMCFFLCVLDFGTVSMPIWDDTKCSKKECNLKDGGRKVKLVNIGYKMLLSRRLKQNEEQQITLWTRIWVFLFAGSKCRQKN